MAYFAAESVCVGSVTGYLFST